MHRLRVVHNFLWYMIYGHPFRNGSQSRSHTPVHLSTSESNLKTESSDAPQSITQSSEAAAISFAKPEAANTAVSSLDPTSSADEDDDAVSSGHSQSEMTGTSHHPHIHLVKSSTLVFILCAFVFVACSCIAFLSWKFSSC